MCNYTEDNYYHRSENFFCCSCFLDALVFIKHKFIFEKTEKCHEKIVNYIRVVDIKSDKLFSIFLNGKEHCGSFIYLF